MDAISFLGALSRIQMALSGMEMFVSNWCLPFHGVPKMVASFSVMRIRGLSSLTMMARFPSISRQSLVCVDFPVPLTIVNLKDLISQLNFHFLFLNAKGMSYFSDEVIQFRIYYHSFF